MSHAQPVLGYSSKSEAAYAMKMAGQKQVAIAEQLGVSEASVGNLIRNGRIAAGEGDGTYYTDGLTGRHRYRLRVEAAKRGLTVRQLVNAVLVAVTDGKKFAALLGDEDEA